MSYYTLQDIANMSIIANGTPSRGQILKHLIDDDIDSEFKRQMSDGVAYFEARNPTISNRHQYYYDQHGNKKIECDENLVPNHKLIHPFMNILISQKSGYIAKNPISVSSDGPGGEAYIKDLMEVLGRRFNNTLIDWIEDASKRGYQGMKVYLDESGFRYVPIDGRELILIYDSSHNEQLTEVIRYYYIKSNDKDLIKAEWWTAREVTFFEQYEEDGEFQEIESRAHMTDEIVISGQTQGTVSEKAWGAPPFVVLKNNRNQTPDHVFVKSLIDDYDITTSDFSNALDSLGDVLIEVSGYAGQDAAEARQNMKLYKVVMTEADEGSGVKAVEISIPHEAKDSHLDRLQRDIFTFGMGVNPNDDDFKDPSGVAIKWQYGLLDIKAGRMIRKTTDALYELFGFATMYINSKKSKNYNVNDLKIQFNISMMMNEAELIDNISKSIDLSKRTRLEKHPYVDNVDDELNRLAEEPSPIMFIDGENNGN